jgi:hypothetical protein
MSDSRLHALTPAPRRIGFAVTCWFLAVAGGIVFPCTEAGQQVVFRLPPVGWFTAVR